MDKTCTCSVTNITTNNTHYNLTGLVEDATYYITLVAVNAVGKSDFVELTSANRESEYITVYIIFIRYTTILRVYSSHISINLR